MSHLSTETVFIEDLDALAKAVGENPLLEWRPNQRKFRWFAGKTNDCEGAICLRGVGENLDYEIGVVRHGKGATANINGKMVDISGKCQLQWDSYGRALRDAVGGDLSQLTQRYSYHALYNVARKQGYTVKESLNDKGEVQLAFAKAGAVAGGRSSSAWSGTSW
ncbi:MAG: DUF1257 domain-containing protein [Bdellovibrionales bacterium]|nr:DUF1257 domain-containing protein [Bdellovibrionales bacterium]